MITVLYLRDTETVCSVSKAMLNTLRTIDRRRFNPVVAITSANPAGNACVQAARLLGAHAVGVRSVGSFDPRALSTLSTLVAAHRIDVIQSHDAQTRRLAAVVSTVTRAAHVPSVEGWIANTRKQQVAIALDKKLIQRAPRVITVSERLKRDLVSAGVDGAKIDVLHNAILFDRSSPPPDGRALRRELGIAPDGQVVSIVGRLSPEKGHATFLQMARAVLKEQPGTVFLIAGDGPIRKQLVNRIEELGLSPSIHLLGHRQDIDRIFAASDVVVNSSTTEGLPNVILEAFAASKPVVATRVGGTPEIVDDGLTGFLVEPGDVSGLAARVCSLLADPLRAQLLGARGHRRVQADFNFQQRTERLERLYEAVVSARQPVHAS